MLLLLRWLWGAGGPSMERKCLCKRTEFLKMAFKYVKYYLILWLQYIYEKTSHVCLNYLIYKNKALSFTFRKLKINTIYKAYLNESPFKYYISILGGGERLGLCLFLLFREGGVRLRIWEPCLYDNCTLPNQLYKNSTHNCL